MPGSGPTTLALPPFAGATRKLILWNVGVFFALAVLGHVSEPATDFVGRHLALTPVLAASGQVWQFVTYGFLPLGLVGTLFAMLTLWFCGSMLEEMRGSRWLYELYFTSLVGGALLASVFSFTGLLGLSPRALGIGPYAGIFGLLIGIAVYMGDQEFLLLFLVRIKARYLVAIYILISLATLLTHANAFGALIELSGALCGYLFLRYVPRKGLASGVTERYYGLRNEYYRAKRRRAAKKFEVYMRGQNREVHFDKDGRYVDPDRDPTDKRWMN